MRLFNVRLLTSHLELHFCLRHRVLLSLLQALKNLLLVRQLAGHDQYIRRDRQTGLCHLAQLLKLLMLQADRVRCRINNDVDIHLRQSVLHNRLTRHRINARKHVHMHKAKGLLIVRNPNVFLFRPELFGPRPHRLIATQLEIIMSVKQGILFRQACVLLCDNCPA